MLCTTVIVFLISHDRTNLYTWFSAHSSASATTNGDHAYSLFRHKASLSERHMADKAMHTERLMLGLELPSIRRLLSAPALISCDMRCCKGSETMIRVDPTEVSLMAGSVPESLLNSVLKRDSPWLLVP